MCRPTMSGFTTGTTLSLEPTSEVLASEILAHASSLPEGTPVCAEVLSSLGSTDAVNGALCELAHNGKLSEVCEGVYLQPVETRFGTRSPDVGTVIPQLAKLWEETIVPCGGASANLMGMTTQIPMMPVYLTSGYDRTLHISGSTVELRHAPKWQLLAPDQPVGHAVRALAWMGPEEVEESIKLLGRMLPVEEIKELVSSCETIPEWMTVSIDAMATCD